VISQEPVACPRQQSCHEESLLQCSGPQNFLKSNAAEMRHIVEEFTRVALSFPAIFFSLHSNTQELMHLEKGSLKQRIVQDPGQYAQCQAGIRTGRIPIISIFMAL